MKGKQIEKQQEKCLKKLRQQKRINKGKRNICFNWQRLRNKQSHEKKMKHEEERQKAFAFQIVFQIIVANEDKRSHGIAKAKLEAKEAIQKHKKYHGLVRLFTPGDNIPSQLRNLEFIQKDDDIPGED